jgi:hypothetical protein
MSSSKRIPTCSKKYIQKEKTCSRLSHDSKNKSPKKDMILKLEKDIVVKHEKDTVLKHEKEKPVKIKGRYFRDRLYYSHLDFKYYRDELRKLGWEETKNVDKAHVILCSYWKHMLKWIPTQSDPQFAHRRLVIWTQDPYHDLHDKDAKRVTIHNVYTGTVFKDNYRYFRWGEKDLLPEITEHNLPEEVFQKKKFPLLALSTRYPAIYWKDNKKTLLPQRYDLIEFGLAQKIKLHFLAEQENQPSYRRTDKKNQQKNTANNESIELPGCKVWGKGWPEGVGKGDSSQALDRELKKKDILAEGLFNIAIENTDAPYYVTEKIWESIESGCLPIYWSNSTIYEDFPKNSFIDAKEFYDKYGDEHRCARLYKFIAEMTRDEYLNRMNKCIRTFNLLCTKGLNQGIRVDTPHRDLHYVDYTRNWEEFKNIFN